MAFPGPADPTVKPLAQRAGLLYVLAGSVAPFAYLYVPGRIIVPGDALATVERLRASSDLLRGAIVAELANATLLIFAALALQRLFRQVDERGARLMAAMMLISVPLAYGNTLFNIAPLVLLEHSAIATVIDPAQAAAQTMLWLRLHGYGLVVGQILWGLWLFPMGHMVLRSGWFPRWMGYALWAAGAGYVANSLGALLLPSEWRWTTQHLQLLGIGEVPFFSFYLLIWGVRGRPVDKPTAALVLLYFVSSAVALALLTLGRIAPAHYGVCKLACLGIVLVLVLRWRKLDAVLAR